MPVLDPYSVSKRARRHGYREVSSSSPYVLTFVHHRKLGCGGWKNKVRPAPGWMLFLPSFLLTAVRQSYRWRELRCRRGGDPAEPPQVREDPVGTGRLQSQSAGQNSEKSSRSHQYRPPCWAPAVWWWRGLRLQEWLLQWRLLLSTERVLQWWWLLSTQRLLQRWWLLSKEQLLQRWWIPI